MPPELHVVPGKPAYTHFPAISADNLHTVLRSWEKDIDTYANEAQINNLCLTFLIGAVDILLPHTPLNTSVRRDMAAHFLAMQYYEKHGAPTVSAIHRKYLAETYFTPARLFPVAAEGCIWQALAGLLSTFSPVERAIHFYAHAAAAAQLQEGRGHSAFTEAFFRHNAYACFTAALDQCGIK